MRSTPTRIFGAFLWLLLAVGVVTTWRGPSAADEPTAEADWQDPIFEEPNIDAPEISRSVGVEGGVVLFWPRVLPRESAAENQELAAALQARLTELVERVLPGRPIDVRPEPERVCPLTGCDAMTVGVLLAREGGGCVAVALVSAPGTAPAELIPWVGHVDLARQSVPFRVPPEDSVTVTDYALCDQLLARLRLDENRVAEAIRAASEH